MLITQVELRNVKSYEDSGPITFVPGVNAITGPTGAGKSTILEAIGFALFGALPYAQKRFLREGAKRGEVVVSFLDAVDEREYQVVRPVGGGTPHVYDPETVGRIVTGRGDLLEFLRERLGLDPTADLRSLFTDAVGVPQGTLTAPFLERPGDRKRKFDRLLQVDDYELAWERLRGTGSHVRDRIADQERRMAELGSQLRRLPGLEEEARRLAQAIADDKGRSVSVAARLEQVASEKKALDMARDRVERLDRELRELKNSVEGLVRQLSVAREEEQKAQEAQRVVEETEQGHRLYEEAQAELTELEGQRQRRDELNAQLAETRQALALAEQELGRLRRALEEIAQAEKDIAELDPLVARQEQLGDELRTAEREVERLGEAQARVTEEQEKLARLQADLRKVQEEIKTLQAVETAIGETERQRLDLERHMAALGAEQAQNRDHREQLRERLSLLEGQESAECPVCRQPLEARTAEELREHYQGEFGRLVERASEVERDLGKAKRELKLAEHQLGKLRKRASSLARPGREDELAQEVKAQQGVVQDWQKHEASLASAPGRVRSLERQLDKIGDPRGECQRLTVEVDKRTGTESELVAARKDRLRHNEVAQGLGEALGAFAGLDDGIRTQREALDSSRRDHSHYLEHRRIARTLPERRARARELEVEKDGAEIQQEKAGLALEKARAQYDESRHQELVEEEGRLAGERAGLQARLAMLREQLLKAENEIDALQVLQTEFEEAEQEFQVLGALSEALDFIRKTIREAGPLVTRALVRTISHEADNIFGDILNDHAMRLRWGEDYGISTEQMGNEREFSQLSGGEKMAAALAVRLALLREMSDICIAFFDEPTAHLDDERRENLAAQISQIKGFHQLFVISHDDTFEGATHHVLRVRKENGVSQVEVA